MVTGPGNISGVIDATQGYLMPFMEGQRSTELCPDFVQFTLRFQGATSGYGYNYVYLGSGPNGAGVMKWVKLTDVSATSRTMCFADSALIDYSSDPTNPVIEENYYVDPPSNQFPGVHFRHMGVSNVAFLDGHVETMTPVKNAMLMVSPSTPWAWPPLADQFRQQSGVFDLSANDGNDTYYSSQQ
jgi:prepilin-type processing-associated H-X9-DG protein